MQTIIMAGGEGTRLRPLTCDVPKPLVRVCGKPLMTYGLDWLARHGVGEAAVTVRYLAREMEEWYAAHPHGVRLRFIREEQPLGTAGCVRHALQTASASPPGEEVLVVSGDALTDIDLTAVLRFHRERGAAVTMVTSHVADPREYGLVKADASGRIVGFQEKPGWTQATCDLANTGIYILSPQALSGIPDDRAFDFAKDLFPALLAQGAPLFAYTDAGYWCDVGSFDAYLQAQRDVLEGRVRCEVMRGEAGRLPTTCVVTQPVWIDAGVQVGEHVRLGPCAVLEEGAFVGDGAKVERSVVGACAYVGEGASLTGAAVCHSASVKARAQLFEGAAAGTGSIIGEDAVLLAGAKVWPGKTVEPHAHLQDSLRLGGRAPTAFDDQGLTGEMGVELTPELCARLGAAVAPEALGKLAQGGKLAIGHSRDGAARALALAFMAGTLTAGCPVWDFGSCLETQFDFLVGFSHVPLGVYIAGGANGCVRVSVGGGLPLTRTQERAIEARLAGGDFRRVSWHAVQEAADMSGIRQLYRQELISLAGGGLSGLRVQVRGADLEMVRLLQSVLNLVGCETDTEAPIRLHIGVDGRRLSVYDEEGGYLFPEQVLALNALLSLRAGEDLALPTDAPAVLDGLAHRHGRRVLRYLAGGDGADEAARRLAARQLWVRDAPMQAIRLLRHLAESRTPLSRLVAELPAFAVSGRTVYCDSDPASQLRKLFAVSPGAGYAEEGARVTSGDGSVFIRPTKSGRGLTLIAEALDTEMAQELCADVERMLVSGAE